MDYVARPYPSWRYHATEPACLVKDEGEDKALGPHWYDSPAKCKTTDKTCLPEAVSAEKPAGEPVVARSARKAK